MNAVEKLQAAVDAAFDEADRQFAQEVRVIIAEQSAVGALGSGATVRRIVNAVEEQAVKALQVGRAQAARSPALRSKLPVAEGRRLDAMAAAAESHFARLGISARAATVLLNEAVARARQPKPPADVPMPSSLKPKALKVAAFIGRHTAAFLFGLLGTLVGAFIIFKLGWN